MTHVSANRTSSAGPRPSFTSWAAKATGAVQEARVASLRQVNAPRSAVAIDNVVLCLAAADHDGYEH